MSEGNGNGAEHRVGIDLVDQLVLRYDRVTGTLEIGGQVLNDDVALGILQQAARVFETRLRIAAAREVQKQALDATRTQQILDSVRHGRG